MGYSLILYKEREQAEKKQNDKKTGSFIGTSPTPAQLFCSSFSIRTEKTKNLETSWWAT